MCGSYSMCQFPVEICSPPLISIITSTTQSRNATITITASTPPKTVIKSSQDVVKRSVVQYGACCIITMCIVSMKISDATWTHHNGTIKEVFNYVILEHRDLSRFRKCMGKRQKSSFIYHPLGLILITAFHNTNREHCCISERWIHRESTFVLCSRHLSAIGPKLPALNRVYCWINLRRSKMPCIPFHPETMALHVQPQIL